MDNEESAQLGGRVRIRGELVGRRERGSGDLQPIPNVAKDCEHVRLNSHEYELTTFG